MPTFYPSEEQFQTAKQTVQNRFVKIELMDYKFRVVGAVEGRCLNGSITIESNSDIRRTGSLTFVIDSKSFDVEPSGSIWLDKYLKLWAGTENIRTGKIVWTNCGIFLIDAPNYNYDISNNTLSISLLDLMSKLTGIRNGYLKGIPIILKAGEKIRDAIVSTLELAGFERYIVNDPPDPGLIPFDLEFSQGATAYDLLKGLLDLYPGYEMFFDTEGTFIYQQIPTGANQEILLDDSLWNNIGISENISVDFQNVKNSIEVYGRTHNPAHFSTETMVNGAVISLTMGDVTEYTPDMIYGFTLTDNAGFSSGFSIKINNLAEYPVYLSDGYSKAVVEAEKGEVYYCVQFKGDYWNWLGHLQSYAMIEDTNPNSPFYVNGTVGRIRMPLFGGDYDNIFSDDLAKQRAEYELYLHSQLNDSIKLNCIPVYWLDVNVLAQYTTKRKFSTDEYIIKSITMGLAPTDTMMITMMKLYGEDKGEICIVLWNSDTSCIHWNVDKEEKYMKWN